MTPTFSGISVLERFERSNAIEICNEIMFDFYPGLPHTGYVNISSFDLGSSTGNDYCPDNRYHGTMYLNYHCTHFGDTGIRSHTRDCAKSAGMPAGRLSVD